MTLAADRLGLTQGAVNQQIRRLEDMLGCSLFDRSRRGLRLTGEGERLLGMSKRFLRLNDEIFAEMVTPALSGRVRFGIPYDLVTTYLPRVLPAFAEANPRIDIDLVCHASVDLISATKTGDIDIAIVEEPAEAAQGEPLCVERLLWLGRQEGQAFGRRPLPLSIVSDACVFRPAVHEALRQTGISWRTVFENGNIDATMTTVRADMAVTPSLASVVPADLRVLGPESGLPPLPNFSISLFVSKGNDRAVMELADHIRTAFVGAAQA